MPKTAKSQWDFGELFPVEKLRNVLTVTELTAQVKRLLEQHIGLVWVGGEVTNLRAQSSGHIYFSLKDAGAQASCVLFRGEAAARRDLLRDGQKVLLQGELTVYEPRGQYQLRVISVEMQGVGALQLAFEKLKQKLNAEGLFAPERKRPLPRYPRGIGLVTSPTGAALRDVLHVIQRRHPGLALVLAPCRVQGQEAAGEIAGAIRLLNAWAAASSAPRIDVILATRGGGSLEDLWAFNEEVVARAIFESTLPVVSAVGHEIDFTISDFAADVRAATPSAAAEILTEGVYSSREFVAEAGLRLSQLVRQRLQRERERSQQLGQRLARAHPRRRLNDQFQRLDDLQESLWRHARRRWRECFIGWQTWHQRLLRVQPAQALLRRRQLVLETERRLRERAGFRLEVWKNRIAQAESRLRLLSPANVLQRGYSITADAASGAIIRAADEVRAGQRLKTRLRAGEISSVVEEDVTGGHGHLAR